MSTSPSTSAESSLNGSVWRSSPPRTTGANRCGVVVDAGVRRSTRQLTANSASAVTSNVRGKRHMQKGVYRRAGGQLDQGLAGNGVGRIQGRDSRVKAVDGLVKAASTLEEAIEWNSAEGSW